MAEEKLRKINSFSYARNKMPRNRKEGSILFSTLAKTIKCIEMVLKMKVQGHMEGKKVKIRRGGKRVCPHKGPLDT